MDWHPAPPGEGRSDLHHSFDHAFGPAQPADFTYWSGVTGTTMAPTEHTPQPDPGPIAPDALCRRSFVLPEFDNIYFCRKTSTAPLCQAKKRADFQPARMPGSLVHDLEVVGTWVATAKTNRPVLSTRAEVDDRTLHEWNRFTDWYAGNTP